MTDQPSILGRAARWTRYVLLAAIALVLALIVTTPRNEYPLTMSRAQAAGVSAAPGYLMTSFNATTSDRFFLCDTNKQIICTYSVTGDQLRLIAARKFDYDSDIWDGSAPLKGLKLEGGNGLSREETKIYLDEFKVKYDELEKNRKKNK